MAGKAWGLWGQLGLTTSIMGFVTLFGTADHGEREVEHDEQGIATRNGFMLVAHVHNLVVREGVADPLEAVRRGATERLIPILMTALAAGLALIPLALAIRQPGSETQTPMASVILSGLLTSTALNLSVAPALYPRFGRIGGRSQNDLAQMAAEGRLGLINPETPTTPVIIAGRRGLRPSHHIVRAPR